MEPSYVPRIFEPTRELYEQAYSNGDVVRMANIELDNRIEAARKSLQVKFKREDFEALHKYCSDIIENTTSKASLPGNITDGHRLDNSARFAFERVCTPW